MQRLFSSFCRLLIIFLFINLLTGCKKASQTEPRPDPVAELKIKAERGDADAQIELANKYFFGDGVQKDFAQAANWTRKAAEQGNAEAQKRLGWMFANGKGMSQDYQEAIRWYQKSANRGCADAQYDLGLAYQNGEGVAKDFGVALGWYRLAAEQGHAISKNNIGYCYQNGLGVPQNYKEAFKWYQRAALQGLTVAEFNLGEFYRNGMGVPIDLVEAYKWHSLASVQNDEDGFGQKSKVCCEQLAGDMSPAQIKDAQQRANVFVPTKLLLEPPTESTNVIVLTDQSHCFEVQIHRILIGQRVVDENLFYQYELDDIRSRKQEILYFEVSVKNVGMPQEKKLSDFDFTLEDTKGNSYSSYATRDHVYGRINLEQTIIGGIAFAVSDGSTPRKLVFDTGLVNSFTSEKLYSTADSLYELKIFYNPIGQEP